MELHSTVTNSEGQKLEVEYKDIDSLAELADRNVSGVHAFCFFGDKLVIVYAVDKGYWSPVGGKVEENESPEDAVCREVMEETNMRVLKQAVIGFQDIHESGRVITQTRSVCIVEPYGDFVSDPDNEITEIKLIDPLEYKNYFDWGIMGDHLIKRALERKSVF